MKNNIDSKYYNKYRKVRALKVKLSPICERCIKTGVVKPVAEVHHKINIMSGQDENERIQLALDIENMESLCTDCHLFEHGKFTIPPEFW
jgi:5-methylcytosine-specific restriction protein A